MIQGTPGEISAIGLQEKDHQKETNQKVAVIFPN